jgi:hypothetical protein
MWNWEYFCNCVLYFVFLLNFKCNFQAVVAPMHRLNKCVCGLLPFHTWELQNPDWLGYEGITGLDVKERQRHIPAIAMARRSSTDAEPLVEDI